MRHVCRVNVARISIHALRVEGDKLFFGYCRVVLISIHALRVEGDKLFFGYCRVVLISIHALRVEGDRSGSSGIL